MINPYSHSQVQVVLMVTGSQLKLASNQQHFSITKQAVMSEQRVMLPMYILCIFCESAESMVVKWSNCLFDAERLF